jgi:hypothetical protein
MSLLWLDGFDNYGTTVGSTVAPSGVLGRYYSYAVSSDKFYVGAGRVGGKSLDLTYSISLLHLKSPQLNNTDGTACILGMAINSPLIGSTSISILSVYDQNGDINCYLKVAPSGHLEVVRSPTTVVATSTKPIIFDAWNYIEWQIEISDSATTIVKLNGETILSATGIDTKYEAGATRVEKFGLYSTNYGALIDDLYILNMNATGASDFLGPIVVSSIRPTSDDTSDWTPSTGTDNYAMVDEVISDDDTTYVATSTSGHYDIYGYGDLTYSTAIPGMVLKSEVRDDAAASPSVYNVIESGTTTSDGTSAVVSSATYTGVVRVSETDPDTAAAWSAAGVNAANFGLKHA